RGEQPRLLQQLVEVAALTVRDLDRDLLVDPAVLGEEDGSESARAQVGEDLVFADCLTQEEHEDAWSIAPPLAATRASSRPRAATAGRSRYSRSPSRSRSAPPPRPRSSSASTRRECIGWPGGRSLRLPAPVRFRGAGRPSVAALPQPWES